MCIRDRSEVVLEAGAIDVLVADTPALKKDAWAVRGALLEAIEADTVPVSYTHLYKVYDQAQFLNIPDPEYQRENPESSHKASHNMLKYAET